MRYMTDDGVEFYIVPDSALCALEGYHPDCFDCCPCTEEDVCTPDSCIYYEEVWNDTSVQRREDEGSD